MINAKKEQENTLLPFINNLQFRQSVMIAMLISRTILWSVAGTCACAGAVVAFAVAVGVNKTCAVRVVAVFGVLSVRGAVAVRTVAGGSCVVRIGAGLMPAVHAAAIFMLACGALCGNVRPVSVRIRKTESGCPKFRVFLRTVEVLPALLTARCEHKY